MDLHAEMMKAHKYLHEELHRLDEAAGGGCDGGSIRDALKKTQQTIADHFEFEEKGGYMNVVLESKPYVHRSVDLLRNEHSELACELNKLIAESASAPIGDLRTAVRTWVQRVREHESRENLFVLENMDRDVEAKD